MRMGAVRFNDVNPQTVRMFARVCAFIARQRTATAASAVTILRNFFTEILHI